MNRHRTIIGCLTLLLIGGMVIGASAQQPSAPAPTESPAQQPADSSGPQSPAQAAPQAPSAPSGPAPSTPAPSTNVQSETRTERTERIVEREPYKILGVDPTVAMIIGAAVLIVIVFALVAMSRREEDAPHPHYRA